jgi:hypothetical protein
MSQNTEHRHQPFDEFVNAQLDMVGVDGICFETVAIAMREVMRDLPDDIVPSLDRLQETLLDCLNVETVARLIRYSPEMAAIDDNALDRIVSLTMMVSFLCYNRLSARFGFETPELSESRQEVQRLWTTLRSASGWVKQAANAGDPIAANMAQDIQSLLQDITPPNPNNHTRTLRS